MLHDPEFALETVSRRLTASLVVGAAGPLAWLLAFHVLADVLLATAVDADDLTGSIDDVVYGLLLVELSSWAVGAGATLLAFVLTRTRRAVLGWLGSLLALPVWLWMLGQGPDLGLTGYVVAVGLLPATVRALLPTRPAPAELVSRGTTGP